MAFIGLLFLILGFVVGVCETAKLYEKKIDQASSIDELKKWKRWQKCLFTLNDVLNNYWKNGELKYIKID